jgi:hypothetical protein
MSEGYHLKGDFHPTVEVAFTGKRDEDVATELRAEVQPLLEQVVALQNRAAKAGMILGFALSRDQFGRNFVQSIDVIKPL